MFRFLVTMLAVAACLATAVAVPVVYLMGMDHVVIGTVTISLIQSGLLIYLAYVAFNVMSGLAGQGDGPLYWLDYIASWIAWLSINVTAIYVAIGLFEAYDSIRQITDIPFAKWLLGGLVLFSWIDVGLLQRHKNRALREHVAVMHATAPPPPPPPVLAPLAPPPAPAPAPPAATPAPVRESYAGPFVLLLLGALVIGLLVLAFNSNPRIRADLGLESSGKAVSICSKSFVINKDGVRMDQMSFDC